MENANHPASFEIENIKFSHLNFDHGNGWQGDFWIAEGEMESITAIAAINYFRGKLRKITSRVSFIGQSFTEFWNEPWLIKKDGTNIAIYQHTTDRPGVGLMFMEKEKEALEILSKNQTIPESFYYYWNDAVNSIGYSSKLLLMFSAIESLVNTSNGRDWVKTIEILGEEITEELYGTKDDPKIGLRHRLVHGEYFNTSDSQKDYLDVVHKKIISYFNTKILKDNLINVEVKYPQRHPFGNREGMIVFIEQKVITGLKEIHSNFENNNKIENEYYIEIFPENSFKENF